MSQEQHYRMKDLINVKPLILGKQRERERTESRAALQIDGCNNYNTMDPENGEKKSC